MDHPVKSWLIIKTFYFQLVYNNSPSFNWTLNLRQQVYDEWKGSKNLNEYDRDMLMSEKYDQTELGKEADKR